MQLLLPHPPLQPGGRLARAALVATGDVLIESLRAWSNCEEYTAQQALMTFAFGVASELVGEKLGDLVAKYGVPAVAAGLRKLGMEELAERLLRNADEVLDGSSPPSLCGSNSFSADTVVMTDEGPKAISALEVGDVVLAYNEATGQTDYYPVVATIAHEDPVVQYLTIEGEIIITTPNHPFYTVVGEWVPAGKLRIGDAIRKADGSYGLVQASLFVYQPQPMYNLTVADAHTYFIGDGQWLVHNTGPNCPQVPGVPRNWTLTQERFKHIVDRHWPTSNAQGAGKFHSGITESELRSLIGETMQNANPRPNTQGRPGHIFEYNFNRQIGIDINGRPASILTVIRWPDGRIGTAYPVRNMGK